MVWNRHRDRRPQAGRSVAGRRETASRDDSQGRFSRLHPRCFMSARGRTGQRFSVFDPFFPPQRQLPSARRGAAHGLPITYTQAIDGAVIGPSAGSCGTAAYRAEPVIVSDIATDPLWADYRDLASAHGLRACWSTPILSSAGRVLGTFAIYYREPRSPTPQEQNLIEQITHLASIAIERERAEEKLRQAQADLERVSRVTTMGELTASLAHEGNQPIAAASTNANTCLRWLAGDTPNIE